MTYITYFKKQYTSKYSDYKEYRSHRRYAKPLYPVPSVLPQPQFMPNYLVRTSDMKVVKGSEVHEGYCALSYSWDQSGEVLINKTTGKSYRIDQGKHEIISSGKTARKKPRGRKRTSDRSKYVTFEGLIQEICKDFHIKYIWYDQKCIDQGDEKKKREEIHQMHNIYSNAYCTVALVPEVGTPYRRHNYEENATEEDYCWEDDSRADCSKLLRSQWMKRTWTLEEAIMSSKILVVGRNVHFWGHQKDNTIIPIFDEKFDTSAYRVLHYAHARTSTKEHDLIFALANIFPDIMEQITVNYKQDIQALMIQFYGLLAKKDLSILCFGKYIEYPIMCRTSSYNTTKDKASEKNEYDIPIQKYDLPSWTGVNGEHEPESDLKTSFKNYIVHGRILQVTCRAIMNNEHRTEFSTLQAIYAKISSFWPQYGLYTDYDWRFAVRIRLQETLKEKLIIIYEPLRGELYSTVYHKVTAILYNLSHFLPIEKMDLQWIYQTYQKNRFQFRFLTEPFQNSAQYAILAGVQFTDYAPYIPRSRYPVVKKEGDYYKAIGMCCIEWDDGDFFDDFKLEEQTFKIH
ncbi:hypothetical protein INT45_004621 [Circinella minor]|uniref:Heterokaryon incompatibility domain-containing protein n=1 Tax=Circinella minor TaxID=1195481 RepID=A0A8H7VJB3_9FUNG|nr:hypothetical protein INT45_004621 [Circinella minor]